MQCRSEAKRLAGRTALALVLVVGATAAAERSVLEAVMARVNDRILTITDFRDRLRQELSQLPEPPTGGELEGFADRLFASVVDEMLVAERADEKRVTVDDKVVDEAIATLREQNQLTDDDAFDEAIASAGLTVEALRQRYRQTLLLQRTVQQEVEATEITAEEVRRAYEEQKERFKVPAKVKLEQLFFALAEDGADREAVLRRVRGLVDRVSEGADLKAEATLAGVELQELGAIPVADLRPELKESLDGLPEGGLVGPVETAGGFQVVRLVRRIAAGFQPFEEVKEELRRRLSQQSYQEQTKGLVERLKKEYLVELHTEYIPTAIARLGEE